MERDFDIVVVGGGHAGIEAAAAAARLGCRTALVSLDLTAIGRMSCNPAIGGVGKGQMVREIDALGGLMGLAADATAVQFRMLNRSKGRAVWGPRCQSDRHAYERFVQAALRQMPNLTLLQGQALFVLTEPAPASHAPRRVVGVRVDQDGRATDLVCRALVLAAGTFLRGLLHCGARTWPGGRIDEPPAESLSESLRQLGLELGRLKTGTCARLSAGSIDYGRCQRQDGDAEPVPFSLLSERIDLEQLPCWITRTTAQVHRLILENRHRAPLFTGQIQSVGPRYCPSVETKVERFADRDSHQLFLEPEGRHTDAVYVNGLSTSLPEDVQERMIRAVPGLERAQVLRFGYAIEYDYAPPTQLSATLEVKAAAGLFLAGQLNGTTGYEEAAGLGLLAGLNAARAVRGLEGVVLGRDQAYLGVMVDDLVTKGLTEPYRMFTSRAEHRLHLRFDNADTRLSELGRQWGLVDEPRWQRFLAWRADARNARELLERLRVDGKSLCEHLANPQAELPALLSALPPGSDGRGRLERLLATAARAAELAVTDCRYAGYLQRQQRQVRRMSELEQWRIPEPLDYGLVPHLRAEAKEKLSAIRPRSLGQALRIGGITPADVTVLAIHLRGLVGRE